MFKGPKKLPGVFAQLSSQASAASMNCPSFLSRHTKSWIAAREGLCQLRVDIFYCYPM